MTGRTDRPGPPPPRAHVVAELKAPEPSAAAAPGSEPADRPAPASRVVARAEVRELLAAAPPRDPAISDETLSNAYVLAGDRCLLVFSNGTGRLYDSRTEMLAAMRAIKPGRVPSTNPKET